MLAEIQKLADRIVEQNEDPNTLDATDIAYLEQIKGAADLLNYTEDGSGSMTALAADVAKALGQSQEWIQSQIDDPYYGAAEQARDVNKSVAGLGHSGLGVGGLANHVEELPILSAAAVERVQRMERKMETCRRCGQNDLFDGAMFTTMAGSGYCDDCC